MRNYLQQSLYVLPFVVLIAAAVFLHQKDKANNESISEVASVTAYNNSDSVGSFREMQNYKMPEPFAAKFPGESLIAMQNSMNPYMWMQLMTHMMNQMMAIPVQMMPMHSGGWINPHQFVPNQAIQPLDPEEYEKLYNEIKNAQGKSRSEK